MHNHWVAQHKGQRVARHGSATGAKGWVPIRSVASNRTVMDYVVGRNRKPKSWVNPFTLLGGGGVPTALQRW